MQPFGLGSLGYGVCAVMRKALFGMICCAGSVAQADEVVIAALGDSLTQGYGLAAEDGFVPQLQGWLDAQGADVRLINAGVSGDTTAGGLARVGWTLTPDVDGMIVALGGNDLLRGLASEQARANLTGVMEAASGADVEVLLIGMQAPGNYGPAYKAQFDAIYPDLAKEYGSIYLESFFAGLTDGAPLDPVAARPFFQSDGIHPNAGGVAKIVEAVGPQVMVLIEAINAD
jgi:acyl-CoA thioesterase-1